MTKNNYTPGDESVRTEYSNGELIQREFDELKNCGARAVKSFGQMSRQVFFGR